MFIATPPLYLLKRGKDHRYCWDENNRDKIIEEMNPTVLKVDVEGAEYEILTAIKPENFKNIREIIFEYHHAHLNDIKTKEKYKKLIAFLKSVFSNVDYRPETKGAWVSNVYCSKA